jgi:purine-cytosine permease-like protein
VGTSLSLPISYAPFANDYSRYVRREEGGAKLVWLNFAGMMVGCLLACLFGAYIASIFGPGEISLVNGLIGISPGWYIIAAVVLGLLGAFGQGSLCLYGTGLDTSSLFPRLARVPATLMISAVSFVLVFIGRFVWNAVDSVSAFVIILVVILTPWVVINLVGYVRHRGQYNPEDLQIFNAGGSGGAYWFTAGWNFRAVGAFVPSVVFGLMFVNTTLFKGPWADSAGGIDLSLVSGAVLSLILYVILTTAFPENGSVLPTVTESSSAPNAFAHDAGPEVNTTFAPTPSIAQEPA